MKFTAALVLFAASVVNASCDPAWADANAARDEVDALCNDGDTIGGAFSGYEEKNKCSDVAGQTLNLLLMHQADGDETMDAQKCIDGFNVAIENCDKNHDGDWVFG